MDLRDNITSLAKRFGDDAYFVGVTLRSGLVGPELPHRIPLMLRALLRFGALGGAISVAAIRDGDRAAVIDELGSVTFAEMDKQSNAIANAWIQRGLKAGDGVSILARNHRGILLAIFAAAKCGARIILLNTDFAGPQIREVAGREGTDLLVCDDEYVPLLEGVEPRLGRFRAWADTPGSDTLDTLVKTGSTKMPKKPAKNATLIILTSGTTGTPKGAPRAKPGSLATVGGLLSKVPFRANEVTVCPAPVFHTLGFAHAMLATGLGSTLVLRRKFDPAATVEAIEKHGATALVCVPVMLQRMVDLGLEEFKKRDLSSLRIIFVAGSQLGVELCKRATESFGPVVYNMYGSTEVAYASIATPEDLAAEPGCVGKVVPGTIVKIFDTEGNELPVGETGRIFVGNRDQFEGYTGGGHKEFVHGLMSSGDVGHFDAEGRLFIDGRDDDMIVSGGENVFPGEIEELLAAHPSIREAAAVGVPDPKFGQRLKAFVVLREGEDLTEEDVKQYVRENLARYKTPGWVVFLDELPRNPTGKILKRELLKL